MPIRIVTGRGGLYQMTASFRKNRVHYLQEALGLAVFMVSACFFSALLESSGSAVHRALSPMTRLVIMGVLMGSTALFIFYSPFTAPSGAHINPAVSLSFLRLGKMCPWDTLFYILFQFAGGLLAVCVMRWLLGPSLIDLPVNSAVTVPGKTGVTAAAITEFIIAFITITVVLVTSANERLRRFTRIIAGCLVCTWVIVAGPVSGFGMNPARSFASALPANTWTAFWIYILVPVIAMLAATEMYLLANRVRIQQQHNPG